MKSRIVHDLGFAQPLEDDDDEDDDDAILPVKGKGKAKATVRHGAKGKLDEEGVPVLDATIVIDGELQAQTREEEEPAAGSFGEARRAELRDRFGDDVTGEDMRVGMFKYFESLIEQDKVLFRAIPCLLRANTDLRTSPRVSAPSVQPTERPTCKFCVVRS